jgi:hypothetical protein
MLLITLPATAPAATVSVSETPGITNLAQLEFQAEPGESNQVTISIKGSSGPVYGVPWTEPVYSVEVVDKGAVVSPGRRCTGGGPSGRW